MKQTVFVKTSKLTARFVWEGAKKYCTLNPRVLFCLCTTTVFSWDRRVFRLLNKFLFVSICGESNSYFYYRLLADQVYVTIAAAVVQYIVALITKRVWQI